MKRKFQPGDVVCTLGGNIYLVVCASASRCGRYYVDSGGGDVYLIHASRLILLEAAK